MKANKTSSERIKKYKRQYRKDPKSKVFPLLADYYRNKGEVDKAYEICKRGIKAHPEFALGHIAKALVLMDINKLELAAESLEEASLISPENLFAWKRLGELRLRLKQPKKVLEAYKMVLFLDPENEKAQSIVKKLEPITAEQYDNSGFTFKKLNEIAEHIGKKSSDAKDSEAPVLRPIPKTLTKTEKIKFQSRYAMVEAFMYRKEFSKARRFLIEMNNIYVNNKNLLQRLQVLESKLPPEGDTKKERKIKKLKFLLKHLEKLQSSSSNQP